MSLYTDMDCDGLRREHVSLRATFYMHTYIHVFAYLIIYIVACLRISMSCTICRHTCTQICLCTYIYIYVYEYTITHVYITHGCILLAFLHRPVLD